MAPISQCSKRPESRSQQTFDCSLHSHRLAFRYSVISIVRLPKFQSSLPVFVCCRSYNVPFGIWDVERLCPSKTCFEGIGLNKTLQRAAAGMAVPWDAFTPEFIR